MKPPSPMLAPEQHIETTVTSATEIRTRNAHFSPAKAITVSTPRTYERAKAMAVSTGAPNQPAKAIPVSDNHTTCPAGQAAVPVGGGGARAGYPAALSSGGVEAAAGPARQAAVPVGGGRAWPGFEIDHSEPQTRVWRSRGRAAAHRHTQRPNPTRQAPRRPDPTVPGKPVAPQAPPESQNSS